MLYVNRIIQNRSGTKYAIVDTDDNTETQVSYSELEEITCGANVVQGQYPQIKHPPIHIHGVTVKEYEDVLDSGYMYTFLAIYDVKVYEGPGRVSPEKLRRVWN